ncbi:MAG: aspartate aminotransferase family protein [Alphaproteobacteria bacterium]|nr:aspartate aminotransferase family protein [Alphaproteobacteria bacterium]
MISAILPTYNPADLAFERGEGAYLFTADGRRFLDFTSGIGVTSLGHAHPHIVAALKDQAGKLWHCSNLYTIPGQQRLAERLVANSFADTVFFCNSGAEAVEAGIKMARRYHHGAGHPERFRIICAENAFHGRTLADISAGGQEKHTQGFGPLVEGFDHVPFGNMNELRSAIGAETAAILVEPVQGEGGIRPASEDYLRGLRAAADEFGLLLFFDEVQSGMGRTGRFFAHEWAGVKPDIVAVAKGIGGGFPLGACLASEKAAASMDGGSHGSTYGGNPLAMAAGNAVLDILLGDGFLDHVVAMAALLRARLDDLTTRHQKIFTGVRGLGLMLGLECAVANRDLMVKLRENGLLTLTAGDDVLRLLPPLVIEESHVDEAMEILETTCREWE